MNSKRTILSVVRLGTVFALVSGVTFFMFTQLAAQQSPGKGPLAYPDGPPQMTDAERAANFFAGAAWDGRGTGGDLDQQGFESFSAYPLFWLGESFAGYNLRSVMRSKYDIPNAHPEDLVSFVYGDCPATGDSGCALPASVQIRPICSVRPEMVPDEVKVGSQQRARGGATYQRFSDDFVMIWTGDISIRVSIVADPSLLDGALKELRDVGAASAIKGLDSLESPNFAQCK